MKKVFLSVLACLFLFSSCSKKEVHQSTDHPDLINWNENWGDDIFTKAKAENKPIILSLEAVWCHWCHVMKEKTYGNQNIANFINDNFVAVRVDQDSNPFLSTKYKRYGWPATIFFAPDGSEIAKKTGYQSPEDMLALIQGIQKEPYKVLFNKKPELTIAKAGPLEKGLKENLYEKFKSTTNLNIGGLKIVLKYLDRDTVEYALQQEYDLKKQMDSPGYEDLNEADQNKIKTELEEVQKISKANFDGALKLLDPEWGGFYQYSTFGAWKNPHFEKLSERQGDYLRAYSQAYMYTKDLKYLNAAKAVVSYLDKFITSPKGAFYSSMDADLVQGVKGIEYFSLTAKEREKKGLPRVDKNIYPSKNGKIIEALVNLYKASSDQEYLERAIKATKYIEKNFALADSGFKHNDKDPNLYLADNLFMARAYLSLYEASADRNYLNKSAKLANFIADNFKAEEAGFISSKLFEEGSQLVSQILKPEPVLTENIKLAQYFNLISHYSGQEDLKENSLHIMKYLGSKELIENTFTEPGILLADYELSNDPAHFTVVGSKQDKKAQELYAKILQYPSTYTRIEWYDPNEGKLVNHDVEYPELERAALFSCANQTCSIPVFEVEDIDLPVTIASL